MIAKISVVPSIISKGTESVRTRPDEPHLPDPNRRSAGDHFERNAVSPLFIWDRKIDLPCIFSKDPEFAARRLFLHPTP
jgi:hypothetical protein